MADEQNPYDASPAEPGQPSSPDKLVSPGQAAYNTVTDTVTGPNLRWRDNLIQLACIVICSLLGAGIGMIVIPDPRIAGALVGGVCGLLAGLLGSGIFLMIYRGMRHLRGKHD